MACYPVGWCKLENVQSTTNLEIEVTIGPLLPHHHVTCIWI